MSELTGNVYLIACSEPLSVKVGYTKGDPRFRLRQLQTGCPTKLVLLGWFPGDLEDEKSLHDDLAEHRLTGEWFAVNEGSSPALVGPINLLRVNNLLCGYHPEAV